MTLSIYLDPKLDKDGNSQIFFLLVGNGKKSAISSGIKAKPENWDGKTLSRKEGNYDLKNSILQTKMSLLNRILAEADLKMIKLDPIEIKSEFNFRLTQNNKKETISKKHLLIEFLKDYQIKYRSIRKEGTLRAINQIVNRIKEFDPEVYLEDVNHDWLTRYCSYLVTENLQDITIKSKHLKFLKLMYREAIRLNIPVSDQIDSFTWKATPKQPFFATWDEVQKIEGLSEFVYNNQELIRDLFILACYTGLRFSDFIKIKKSNISIQNGNPVLRVLITKTGFDYHIPINLKVFDIIQKYNYQIPTVSQQEFNREIKRIAKRVVEGTFQKVKSSGAKRVVSDEPRHKMFSSHTGRRSFARHMVDNGVSIIVVSKILGHASLETTINYIGYQINEIEDVYRKVFG